MVAELTSTKPRLLFFRWPRLNLPTFLNTHLDEHVSCLSLSFDVHVIDENCDYDEVCDLYQPDLCLFESGVYAADRQIEHTSSHPSIPKLGLLNADAYDPTRAAFISDMARWGIDTYFTISVSMAEYTPEIADRLFVWPNSVDPAVFRDYGLVKNIPVLFTGSQARHYPWRNAMYSALSPAFPHMTCPHYGWEAGGGTERMISGERYARLINSASVAPACGTIAHELVRKHLEIPGAGACLVAERTAALEAAGFVDGVNVVFTTPQDAVERLDSLFAEPGELERITRAGFDLVHTRHTWNERDQLLQWLRLHRTLKSGERIVQTTPFAPLQITSGEPSRHGHVVSGGRDRVMLADAWTSVRDGRPEQADRLFRGCLNYCYMPEAVVGLTWTLLQRGQPEAAADTIRASLDTTLRLHHAVEPDPVQWAMWIRVLVCRGKVAAARECLEAFPGLRHAELSRLADLVGAGVHSAQPDRGDRPTVSPLPPFSDAVWHADFERMMTACGQAALHVQLISERAAGHASQRRHRQSSPGSALATLRKSHRQAATASVRSWLRPWRNRLMTTDFTSMVVDLTQRENLVAALVLGHPSRRGARRSLTMGLGGNPQVPVVTWGRADDPTQEIALSGPALLYVSADTSPADLVQDVHAALVIIESLSSEPGSSLFQALVLNKEYDLIRAQSDPDGAAVFRRRVGKDGRGGSGTAAFVPDGPAAQSDIGAADRRGLSPLRRSS